VPWRCPHRNGLPPVPVQPVASPKLHARAMTLTAQRDFIQFDERSHQSHHELRSLYAPILASVVPIWINPRLTKPIAIAGTNTVVMRSGTAAALSDGTERRCRRKPHNYPNPKSDHGITTPPQPP
jgi:hypothetical protein